jgi:hypothetical protein
MRRNITNARIDTSGKKVPSIVTDGIVAGLHEVLRSQLRDKKQPFTSDVSDGLRQWALSYCDPAVTQLERFNRAQDLNCVSGEAEGLVFTGDTGALLSAAAKVAVDKEHGKLTPHRICSTAGVPRRIFDENFSHADDCLAAALDLYVDSAIMQAKRAGENGLTPAGSVYLAVRSLCIQVARGHKFARLCFDENVAADVAKVRCRRPLPVSIARLFEDVLSANELVAQASAGACWGVLQNEVTIGRARNAPRLASVLSYLILAPIIGASATVETICQERMMAGRASASAS